MLARVSLTNFRKAFGIEFASLHGEGIPLMEKHVNNKFKATIKLKGCRPDKVFNIDATDLFWKRMLSRTSMMLDEDEAP